MTTRAHTILDTVPIGALATVNRDRTPLVTPLHFARCGEYIIWISDRESRHSHNVFRIGRAEFVVWDEQKNAVFITTNVQEVTDDDEATTCMKAYQAKLGQFRPVCQTPQLYKAPIGQYDENATTNNWLHYTTANIATTQQ